MTDLKQAAVRLAVIRELEQRIKDARAELNMMFVDSLDVGDSKAASLDDGTKLGKVSYVSGRNSATVTDERALLAWTKANRPDEVVSTVRESFVTYLKDSAKRHDGFAVDESTGEIVPGMSMREGNPYIMFRAEKGSGEVIAARWRELLGDALKALPGGEA